MVGLLAPLGIKVAYTPLGVLVALIFIGLPFVVRTMQPVLEEAEKEQKRQRLFRRQPLADLYARDFPDHLASGLNGFCFGFCALPVNMVQ